MIASPTVLYKLLNVLGITVISNSVFTRMSSILVLNMASQTECTVNTNKKDLTLIPDGSLTIEFIDAYIRSKCKSSGANHISKGYNYFHEGYLRSRESKYIYVIYSNYYCNILTHISERRRVTLL